MGDMLSGKVVVVTGAGSGIGQSGAILFAEEGASVLAVDLNHIAAEETVRHIRAAGGTAEAVAADVTVASDVERVMNTAVQSFGRLDCAFNNAGIGPSLAPTAEASEDEWNRVIAVNLTGVFLCTKYAIRTMLAGGGPGAIVNMSSVGGIRAVPLQAAYSASKHGVIGITKTAATEYGGQQIRVNAVCPGVVGTDATKAFDLDWNAIMPIPAGRIAEPREVVELVAWLMSDRSSYVTGQAICVDGGNSSTTFVPK